MKMTNNNNHEYGDRESEVYIVARPNHHRYENDKSLRIEMYSSDKQ